MKDILIESTGFSEELINELRRPTFMRTKIDVVYSDIVNWEVEGILYNGVEKEKGSQKKLSYIEYIWLKMIQEFKSFNFSIEEINYCKQELFKPYPVDDLLAIAIAGMKQTEIGRDALRHDAENVMREEFAKLGITILEFMVSAMVQDGNNANVLCFKSPVEVFCITERALNHLEKEGSLNDYENLLKQTHLNISLTPIVSKFLREGKIDSSKQMILTSDEYKIITEIRKRIKGIKSVSVHYSDNNIRRIDIQNLKPIKAESSLMAVIKKSEYSKIEVVTEKGNIVSLLHTEKIKV